MRLNVTSATLGGPIHTPVTGQFGPKIVLGEKRNKGAVTSMTYEDSLLFVTVDGVELAVPAGYVTHMVLERKPSTGLPLAAKKV